MRTSNKISVLTHPESILKWILLAVLVAPEVILGDLLRQVEGVVEGQLDPGGWLVAEI